MSNKLSNKLERIDNAVNTIRTKVALPEAAIEEVAAAVENMGSGSEEVEGYKADSINEMQTINAKEGDICVVKETIMAPFTAEDVSNVIIFPHQVTLPSAVTSSINGYMQTTTYDYFMDIRVDANTEGFNFSISGEANVNISYTVVEPGSLTYVMTVADINGVEYTGGLNSDQVVLTLPCTVYATHPEMWSPYFGYFMTLSKQDFKGLFEYKNVKKLGVIGTNGETHSFLNSLPIDPSSTGLTIFSDIKTAPDGCVYSCDVYKIYNIYEWQGKLVVDLYVENGNLVIKYNTDDASFEYLTYLDGTFTNQNSGTAYDTSGALIMGPLKGFVCFLSSFAASWSADIFTDSSCSTLLYRARPIEITETNTLEWSTYNIENKITIEDVNAGINFLSSRGIMTGVSPFLFNGKYDALKGLKSLDGFSCDDIDGYKLRNLYQGSTAEYLPASLLIDASKADSIEGLFDSCPNLKYVDVSKFNLTNSTKTVSISNLFYKCPNLEQIDGLENLCCKIDHVHYIATNCAKLKRLDLRNVYYQRGTVSTPMRQTFMGCTSLEYLDIRNMNLASNTSYTANSMNAFDGVPTNCTIIVKDDSNRTYIKNSYPNFTNIYTVAEWQALGNE